MNTVLKTLNGMMAVKHQTLGVLVRERKKRQQQRRANDPEN